MNNVVFIGLSNVFVLLETSLNLAKRKTKSTVVLIGIRGSVNYF